MFTSLGNSIPRNGLVGEWLLDGNANDTSLNGLTGTNANGVYVKGNRGYVNQAWQGNGTNARIQCFDNAVFPSGGNYCINLWVKPIALPTSGSLVSILSKYDGGANPGGYDIQLYNNSGIQQLNIGFNNASGNGQFNSNNYTLSTTNRSMITSVLNGTSLSTYINGTLLSTTTVTGTPADNTKLLNIGAFGYYTPSAGDLGRYFNGYISLIRIYNRALSNDEMQLLYLEGQKLLGPTSVAKYPKLFDGLVYYGDFRGSAHNLVDGYSPIVTGATLTTDRFGNSNSAYSFSGGSNRIALSNSSINSGIGGSFTYSFWYKPSNVSAAQLFLYDWGGTTRNIYLEYTALGVINFFRGNGGVLQDIQLSYSPGFSNGTYYHIVITQTGTSKAMYINGIQVATQTSTLSGGTTANTIYISSSNGTDTGVQGVIDESILFNRALSSSEVSMLYKLTLQDYIYPNPSYDLHNLRDGLVLDLNEQGKDLSGNGNNGTLVNSPTVVRQGKAKGLSYNGSNQAVNLGTNKFPTLVNNCTFTAWIRNNSNSTTQSIFSNGNNGTGGDIGWYFGIKLDGVNNTYNFTKPGIINENTGITPSVGRDDFISLTITSNIGRLYINSVLVWTGVNSSTILNNTQTSKIGCHTINSSNAQFYNGRISNPKLLNRALSDKEIQALYYSQKGNFVY